MKVLKCAMGLMASMGLAVCLLVPTQAEDTRDPGYAQRYAHYHHKGVLTSDYAHRYRYYHGEFPGSDSKEHPTHPDAGYADRFKDYHHQNVLSSDYAHRYRYYHGQFPKANKANH